MTPCSVKLLVKPCEPPLVPMAARLPCGVGCAAAALVCVTGEMLTRWEPPPRYSGRCSRASGLMTPKWLLTSSVYRLPPRASRS